MTERRYATVKMAAEYASTSANTIRRWIHAEKIVAYRVGTRFLRVDLNDIDRVLTDRGRSAA